MMLLKHALQIFPLISVASTEVMHNTGIACTGMTKHGSLRLKILRVALLVGLVSGVMGSFTATAESNQSANFTFFTREKVKKDPRVVRLGPHPCGEYALARVSKMPGLEDKGYLIPDKVIEVDAANKTLYRWAKPIDTDVVAVEGDRILIKADQHYWIEPSGEFQLQIGKIVPKAPTFAQRVKKHPEFKGSGYAGQWRYRDLKTGKIRQIIYEGNCT
jgi:hypothetical protein